MSRHEGVGSLEEGVLVVGVWLRGGGCGVPGAAFLQTIQGAVCEYRLDFGSYQWNLCSVTWQCVTQATSL